MGRRGEAGDRGRRLTGTGPKAARAGVLIVFVATAAGLLAACGSSVTGPAQGSSKPGTTITLYNAQHPQTTDALVAAFTRQTGIKVRVENDDEDVLTAQIEEEGARSPADVFYAENSNWLQQLDDRDMLAPVSASTLASVPHQDNAPNGEWVGVSARISVMVYDPANVSASELPSSVLDLAKPQWKGKIEIAPSETDFWPIVVSVARSRGHAAAVAWLEGLKANAGGNDNVPDNETLTSDINQGLTDLAVINHYYYYRFRAEIGKSAVSAKIAYFAAGDPGVHREHLRGGRAQVVVPPGRGREVPRLPDQPDRADHPRPQRELRVPHPSRRVRQSRADPARRPAPRLLHPGGVGHRPRGQGAVAASRPHLSAGAR